MKRLMLGNEAVARGLYEAVAGLFPAIREHPVRRFPNMRRNMKKYTPSGPQMKR